MTNNENDFIDLLDKQYDESDKKNEIDYWNPLTKIIMESINLRDQKNLSQADLAKIMKTTQSVISRFENMGRLPNYDFISRLAIALGSKLGLTLYGKYMAVVPLEKQNSVEEIAKKRNISTQELVQDLLDMSIKNTFNQYEVMNETLNTTADKIAGNIYDFSKYNAGTTIGTHPIKNLTDDKPLIPLYA